VDHHKSGLLKVCESSVCRHFDLIELDWTVGLFAVIHITLSCICTTAYKNYSYTGSWTAWQRTSVVGLYRQRPFPVLAIFSPHMRGNGYLWISGEHSDTGIRFPVFCKSAGWLLPTATQERNRCIFESRILFPGSCPRTPVPEKCRCAHLPWTITPDVYRLSSTLILTLNVTNHLESSQMTGLEQT